MAEAEYHRVEDPEEDSPPGEEELLLHVTEGRQGSWHHIKNLDDFFTKIYHFHQKNGFACMLLSDLFELGQFVFVVAFSAFLLCCVRYDVLFADRPLNRSHVPAERSKVTLPDAVLPAPQCARRIAASGWLVFLLAMAALFWLCRLLKVLRGLLSYWDIRRFYGEALRIPAGELCSYSWQEVQARLMALQREQPLCVHKRELTELDIHHRILRFTNYAVAMVNKSLLPVRFRLPLLGPVVFLTRGLHYNLELLLFRGPGALFLNSWSLRPQCKRAGERLALARHLARGMVLLGAANLLLCPLVLVWQLLYAFFSYAEVLRRRPGVLGTRRWSLYGRLYLRHFNELQHELTARLGRGHRPATRYMNSFASPMLAVLARHVAFFAGSVLAVLIALTVYDEDVLTVQHILTAITLLGLLLTVARSFIPDEHSVQCPEQLLQRVLAHTHYMPQHWQGSAGAPETRNEMAQLFQYKAVFILEELLSPVLTPLILIFALPSRALDIVDFFRNFTVEVVGVGDVCSFAQLDVRRHGNPQWLSEGQTEASVYQRAENGKTELSLMHFAISNPRWQPPPHSGLFLNHVKERLQRDAAPHGPAEGALRASLLGDGSAAPDALLSSVLTHPLLAASGLLPWDRRFSQPCSTASAAAGVLLSLSAPLPGRGRGPLDSPERPLPEESPVLSESRLLSLSRSAVLAEVASAEMSLHAIYIHELHLQQQQSPVGPWVAAGAPKRPSVTTGSAARASQHELREMPLGGWAEEDEEDEDEEEEQSVPPIATTPPRRSWREESLSQSSSETQASAASGISLGEAIRQRTAVNQEIDSWYQLPGEVDASRLTAASETKLGLASDRNDLTEFPTLEEGVLPSAETSRRQHPEDTVHGLLLDIQDSQLSPCLPLLMYSTPGQRILDETLFQQSERDFIHLRGVPDVSGASEQHSNRLHVAEAAWLTDVETPSDAPSDCYSLSQHPLSFRQTEPGDASYLSQQASRFSERLLMNKKASEDCRNDTNEKSSIPHMGDKAMNQTEASLAKQTCGTSAEDACFTCNNNVLAPVFELSEKEKELLRRDEFSSSENSSCKAALTKNSGKSEREMQMEKVKMAESESEGCLRHPERLEKEKAPELGSSKALSDDLKKDSCKNSGAQGMFSAKTSEITRESKECRVGLNDFGSMKFVAVTNELQGAFLDREAKQGVREEELSPIVPSSSDSAPKQLAVTNVESPSCTENAQVEVQPGVRKAELTISDVSIERGHKVTDISPSLNFTVDDGSFFRHFSHPSYQSTPGILLKNVKTDPGAHVIKSDVHAPPLCLNEDNSGNSLSSTPTSGEKQRSLQCAQKENNKHFDSLKLKYPHTGRIQSLPSLYFMEKVDTWNMSQPENMSDALASRDQSVISHRKKAYSVVARSANNILSMQNSSRNPEVHVAAPSGETHSLENIHFHDKISERVHPLTRSQSDNSVHVASKNNSQTDVVQPVNREAMQPLEGKSNVSGVPENRLGGSLIHKLTTEIASLSVDKGAEGSSVGQSSYPNASIPSERVAHLIKEDGNSPTDDQKRCDGLENPRLPHNLDIGHVSVDNVGDISPDSLNLPACSGESSHGALGSPVITRHFFTSAGDDNFIPSSTATVLETPEKEELNIEERIPIYLRNLGIDQSPGTILTPFVPRGPIREVEFSPSDLRTLKDSTDTLTRTIQQPQGDLLTAVDVIQTSFNSGTSTVSISIPMNSETDSDTFSPRELSPRFSIPFGEKPKSQCTMSCHKVEATTPLSTQWETECSVVSKLAEPSQHLQTVSPDCHSNRESPMLVAKGVQDLLVKKELKDVSGSSQRWTASSSAGVEDEQGRGSQTSSEGSEKNKGQESDYLIGSGALQEIRKLLAEAENIAGSWHDPVFSNASSSETESSPVQIEKEDGTKDSELVKDSIAPLQKVMSWAESMNQRSIHEGSITKPQDSCKDDLKWECSFDGSLCSREDVVEMTREFRTGKSVGRSEPEGCSSVTTDRNLPAVVAVAQSSANSEFSTERPSEMGSPSPSEPQGSVINVPASFQNKLSKANVAVSTAGGIRESSGSSSGDSLAAHVKNLLGNPLMLLGRTADISGGFQSMMSKTSAAGSKAEGVQESHGSSSGDSLAARVKNLLGDPSETLGSTTDVPGGFQSVLSKPSAAGSKAGGVQESDGSSSADSLAARVKSLLRNGSPLMPATPILRSSDEEERKARAWVKLKLANRSQEAVLDLSEEDRQRIEEIKAELLLSAKKSGQAKGTRSYSSLAASVYSCNQEADEEHSKASSDKRFHSDSQTQAFRTKELLEPSLQHVVPLYRAELSDCCLLKNTQLKSLSTAEPPTCSQHQAIASSRSGCVGLHLPLEKQQDTRVMSFAAASDAQTAKVPSPAQKKLSFPKCSEEMSKQITSITFSSRRRFQSPLTSVVLDGFFSGDDLDEIMPLEMDSVTTEEQSHGKQHWERSETCPLSGSAPAGSQSNEIAFTADKDRFHDVSADGNRAGAYQETDCLSDREPVTVCADERQTPSAKNLDTPSQDVTELDRHSARLLGLDCDRRFSQGMKGLHESHSISSYQQEKSSPTSHIQLCESLEGSDPAIQTDLPKDHGKLLEEEKCPSDAVPFIQKEVSGEQIDAHQHSDEILPTMSPSSPIKKVLSCVHITLSPKCNNSELHRDLNTENEMRLEDKLEVNSQPVPLKTPETLLQADPKLPTADLIPEDQRCSSFPVPSSDPCSVFSSVPSTAGQELLLHGSEKLQAMSSGGCSLKNICSCTDPAKSRKSTSDATTQITTESPGKTTFSAEIYVNSQDIESSAHQSSTQKAKEFPQNTASSLNRTSSFPRQGGQPLLLPYKPSGSTEMYYVPYLKAGAKISPLGSENNGSNDALPPGLPANVLGIQDDKPPDTTAIKHKEGVCSERAKPKLAWAEEQMIAQEGAPGSHRLKSVNATHSVFKSAQFYLHHPVPTCENYLLSNSELSEDSSGVGHTGISSSTVIQNRKKAHRHRRVFSAHHKKDGEREFFPLTAEADYSKNEDLNVDTSLNNETPGEELLQRGRREADQMAACSQMSNLRENVVKDLPLRQRTHSAGSLDELWVKFLERQKRYQQHHFRRNGELTLVERLDRLARVLQNPIRYTLIPAKSERSASENTSEVKEQEKIRLPEKSMAESTLGPHAARVKERPRINCRERSFVELRKDRSGEKVTCHTNEISEHRQYLDTCSDTCSETRLSKDLCTTISSTISESDAVTQTDIETTTQTEVSSSVSTIDTARLVRAFGHRRVQVSPRLSQLYHTIHQQKSRSEKWDEESSGVRDVEHPKVASERHRKQKETQKALDPALTSSGSWGPSSALSNKRRARMLNKGIQAGDLEIVNGATKKNTRDVGVTFPTPRSIQPNQRPRDPWHRVDGIFGESDGMVTDHQAAGSKGISWFVQAEDLKFESRKENRSNSIPGPGSSWFEPFTTTKPWREPLREKNFQEQQYSKVTQSAVPERDAETRPTRPTVKLTLQEALAVHRPDFISRSGERVKHLKLVMEERRIQSALQSEQEELFNPPEKRKGYRNASHVLPGRGHLIKEKRRAIPKSEMVQRSKRIYEQLPEVQKKREEEKRKSEYNSYRLKAQLYKMKITNHVLGRKVPWN